MNDDELYQVRENIENEFDDANESDFEVSYFQNPQLDYEHIENVDIENLKEKQQQ